MILNQTTKMNMHTGIYSGSVPLEPTSTLGSTQTQVNQNFTTQWDKHPKTITQSW